MHPSSPPDLLADLSALSPYRMVKLHLHNQLVYIDFGIIPIYLYSIVCAMFGRINVSHFFYIHTTD